MQLLYGYGKYKFIIICFFIAPVLLWVLCNSYHSFSITFRCIFFSFCAPEVLTFLKSCQVYLMRKTTWAPLKYFVVVFALETLHTSGVAILFYAVLPNLDTLRAGMVANGVLLFPSMLSIFQYARSSSSRIRKYILIALDGKIYKNFGFS